MKKTLTALLAALILLSLATPANAQTDPGYLNQPHYLYPQIGEWYTLNNQPMVMIAAQMPFGYYTGMCAFYGLRADAMMTTSVTSTGAIEGQVHYYAMDNQQRCRPDIPIQMKVSDIAIWYSYAPGENLNSRSILCVAHSAYGNSNYVFTRYDTTNCRPPGFASFDLGWYQMQARLSWKFNDDWPWYSVTRLTWPAALVNNNGCFGPVNNWGQCLYPDGTWH